MDNCAIFYFYFFYISRIFKLANNDLTEATLECDKIAIVVAMNAGIH